MASTKEASVMEPNQTERIARAPGEAIRASGVSHGFGDLEVLDGIDLNVAEGEVVGLVGPSGCGKSTLLELVSGLAVPRSGSVEVEGGSEPELPARELRLHASARPPLSLAFGHRQRRDGPSEPG